MLLVSSLHHGSPSIPKMHLETLKPFASEERMLGAVMGVERREGYSLKQFPAYPAETCNMAFLPYFRWPKFAIFPIKLLLMVLFFEVQFSSVNTSWSLISGRTHSHAGGSEIVNTTWPLPSRIFLHWRIIIWVILITLGSCPHNQTILRAMVEGCIRCCVGTGNPRVGEMSGTEKVTCETTWVHKVDSMGKAGSTVPPRMGVGS